MILLEDLSRPPFMAQAEQMRQGSDEPWKVDHGHDMAPACSTIECADISCIAPLKLQRREGQCCPICWAEDHEVPLDRHQGPGSGKHVVKAAAQAPPSCSGVKCFTLMCAAGQMPHYVP